MASEGTDLVFRELSFSVLNNAGNGTLTVYDAGGTLHIHSTGSGNTILNGGDFSTLYAADGTITLVGDIDVYKRQEIHRNWAGVCLKQKRTTEARRVLGKIGEVPAEEPERPASRRRRR